MYLIIILFIVALDQGTKLLAFKSFQEGIYIEVINDLFYFTYLKNPGDTLSIIPNNINFKILFTVIAIVFILHLFTISKDALKVSLCFILAGCISNLIERALSGSVADFLAIPISSRHFVFNIADIFIYIGALIAICCLITECRKDNTYLTIK